MLRRVDFYLGLAVVVFLGFYMPGLGALIRPHINTLIFFSLLLIGLRIESAALGVAAQNLPALAISLILGFGAMPLVSLLLAHAFFTGGSALYVGVILAGAVPTTQASSVIWTDLAKGNHALALVLMAASNITGTVLSPLIIYVLLNRHFTLSPSDMIGTLLLYVLLPILIGQTIQRFTRIPQSLNKISRNLNIFVIWLTVLTALSAANFVKFPFVPAIACIGLQYWIMAASSFGLARVSGMNIKDALAIMFCTAQVTLTVAAVVGFSFFDPSSVLYVVLYHIFQQAMGQLTAQLAERYEGKKWDGTAL